MGRGAYMGQVQEHVDDQQLRHTADAGRRTVQGWMPRERERESLGSGLGACVRVCHFVSVRRLDDAVASAWISQTRVRHVADRVVVTSDNPRTEDPEQILNDVVSGIPQGIDLLVEGDRASAIATAIAAASPADLVLVAGKGHEDYQILGTEKIHFDDREEAEKALRLRLSA